MQRTQRERTQQQVFFQKYLKSINKRDLKLYYLFREGFRKRIHSRIPDKYLYFYGYDLINLNMITQKEEALKELIYLYNYCKELSIDLHQILLRWIGDMYLTMGQKEEAFPWYKKTGDHTCINIIISYYNRKGLEKMPFKYWQLLFEPLPLEDIPEEETTHQFFKIISFLSHRLLQDKGLTLLDYLNNRSKISYPYQLFDGAVYGNEKTYPINPYKEYVPCQDQQMLLKELYSFGQRILLGEKTGEPPYLDKELLPQRIRRYLAEMNILRIVTGKKKKTYKRIILDENKIKATIDEQVETAKNLQSMMQDEGLEQSKPQQDIHDLQDLFQKTAVEKIPRLKGQEKDLIKLLIGGSVPKETLKMSLGQQAFINQITNAINEKFYPYLGAPFIEQKNDYWFINDDHRSFLKQVEL